jgi:hypothetical protein
LAGNADIAKSSTFRICPYMPQRVNAREQMILILGLAKPLVFAVYADLAEVLDVQETLV